MRIRPEHLEAFRGPLRAGTPDRVLQDLRAGGIAAELDPPSRSIVASDSRGAVTRLAFRPDGLPDALVQPSGATYRFEHDPQGLLTAIVHPGDERLEIGYDAEANVSRLVRPGLCRYDFAYAAGGQLAAVHFPDGHQATLAYGDDGQLTAVTDRAGATTRYHRRDGRLQSVEDALGRHTVYEADEAGALSAVRFADGSRQEYAYDPDERVAAVTARDGTSIIQELDDAGALRAVRWADGSFGEFDFDGDGRLVAARTEAREVRHTFNPAGDPLTEETDAGRVEYRYDGDGRLVALTTPQGDTLAYEYDADGRISAVRDWEGRENRFVYAENGTLAEVRYGNGLVERQRYARLGRVAEAKVSTVDGQVVSLQRYEYDVCERLVSVVDIHGENRRIRRFSYDAESRLVEDFDPVAGQAVGSYRYDRKGNLVRDGVRQVEVGPLDEPLQYGLRRIQYDALGNVRRTPAPAGAVECSFRANGFLAELRAGGRVWRYEYDAFCRRVLKTDGITTWRFGWAGHQLLWEEYEGYPGADIVRRDYLFVPETVAPLAFRENGRTYWLQVDARGAVIRAFDADGGVVWSAEYDSFGRAKETVSHIRQPWRLLGQYHDPESGLHYNFARYYNPATKSYLSRDPLWSNPEATNYSYARNDPWNRADPFGTIAPLLVAAGIVAVSAVAHATVAAVTAAALGQDPVAAAAGGAIEGAATAIGVMIGGVLGVGGAAVGGKVGSVLGSGVGAFVESVIEDSRKGRKVCIECAARYGAAMAVLDFAVGELANTSVVKRVGKNLRKRGGAVVKWARKGIPVLRNAARRTTRVMQATAKAVGTGVRRVVNALKKPSFPRSVIDKVVASSARQRSIHITEGARAIQKKIGHAAAQGYKSAFEGIEATQENAERLIRNIMSKPEVVDLKKKYTDVYNAVGQGVRIEPVTQGFVGFLEKIRRRR